LDKARSAAVRQSFPAGEAGMNLNGDCRTALRLSNLQKSMADMI
jgi:hypothetical protein